MASCESESPRLPVPPRRRQWGATLVEVLTSVGVLAAISGIGVPAFRDQVDEEAVRYAAVDFEQGVRRARSEALRRNTQVTLCAMDPASQSGHVRCQAHGKDWSAGWVVFIDGGVRGQLDADDVLLRVQRASFAQPVVTGTLRYMSFQGLGFSTSAASNFRFQPRGSDPGARGLPHSLLVCVNKPGRTRVVQGDDCA